MSRERTLILLGILTALAPFSGLPSAWLQLILPVVGVAVIAIGYIMRREESPQTTLEA